ncbi:MAG: DUF4445 domain-containing protein [Clostridiales bacterium]|nr:DUF4445 domain-containing protein [Clostridiales bacterium]
MSILNIHQGPRNTSVEFTPPTALSKVLTDNGFSIAQPCGGLGSCGKCAVLLSGAVSVPNAVENRCGVRLACQAVLHGDADVTLPDILPMQQIEGGRLVNLSPAQPMRGQYGAAVDIGTTTIALQLYSLGTGALLGASSMLNPQTSVAADVIGRIDAALHGKGDSLRGQVESAIATLLATACSQADISAAEVSSLVVTGNTTMLYLLTQRNPCTLSRAPFEADFFFGHETSLLNRCVYLPHCLHAFVGADTSCALLASGMTTRDDTALLCDIGTNGEMALWHRGKLYIASTAAGPAFEGAGISCGCTSILGAIDKVDIVNGMLKCHTIGNRPAVGVCGSGLLDAIAALLDTESLDETGYLEDECFDLAPGVTLTQADIRAVQLAKAATYAGIMTLLSAADCTAEEVKTLYIAGGFGSHLNLRSAVRIGLIPEEHANRVQVIGNAALDGAAMLLLDVDKRETIMDLRKSSVHVRLDGNSEFANCYVDAMLFE